MSRVLLSDGRGNDVVAATEEELIAALETMDAQFRKDSQPRIAALYLNLDDPHTPRMWLGLGGDECMLLFDLSDTDDNGVFSSGARVGDSTEVWFAFGTGDSAFRASTLIPREVAFAAAVECFRTGRRPTNLRWQEL